ncbi:dolichyl-P-Glc:Man(9)GlcNAc(2)-PP-dolichol alpha-1,3-glucosyltransferase ALG6 [Aspergillus foveolatus]|uniref:dolichyl-P-Glc:Man(9)GlcNAc(2)-PP-dolichol alpha-1,3-glucosyltransferase ALG6 n=1 Tax=Aspergillus foveolatus TaxID=210207 RepID=UPI003CCDB885
MAPSVPSSYRPRKKRKPAALFAGSNNSLTIDAGEGKAAPAFPLVSFLWGARAGVSQWLVLPLILMTVGLFRWAVSLWGYSGFNTPPMYGDFEAQRHWMEITVHLPLSKWYTYDLQYWGLDYPPLTAYHSWLLGKIGSVFDPTLFALDDSRGTEGPLLKVFMRATVIVSEYLVYIPAIVTFLRRYTRMQAVPVWSSSIALSAILLQPATILIDHGHFQYNTVMLGLFVASLDAIMAGRMLWACIFFVGALGFKQMALYYAPVMFAFLLGICIFPRIRLVRLLCIALVTIASFTALFLPLLLGATSTEAGKQPVPEPPLLQAFPVRLDHGSSLYLILFQLTQIVHRIFPFSRGLFEDKVANAWCAIHTVYKLHRFEPELLKRVSLGATLASILVPCAIVFRHPRASILLPAFATVGWGFFLFSFQVHEKSVLLPLLPMTLLIAGDGGLNKDTRSWVGWANILGSWTLYPLLKRDGLQVPYFVVTCLWAYLLGLPPTSWQIYSHQRPVGEVEADTEPHGLTRLLHSLFYLAMVGWHVLEAFIPPPPGKPDLWVVLNVLIGAGGFGISYLWCLWKLVSVSLRIDLKVEDARKKNQ